MTRATRERGRRKQGRAVRTCAGAIVAAGLFGLPACRSLDPGSDYDRAVEEIRAVTGAVHVYHPELNPAETQQRVTELMAGELELSEAVELGLLNNPVLQASFRSIGMAHADRVQAGLLTNPSLIAALQFPSSGGASVFEGRLFGSLLDVLQLPKRERTAERSLQRRTLELAHQAALLAAEIRVAYAEAIASNRLLEIARENLSSARELVTLGDARLAASAGTAIEANLAQLEFLDTKVALFDAELAVGESQRQLQLLLGLEQGASGLRLIEPSGEELTPLPTVEELEALALVRRLDIRAASEAVRQAEAEVENQRGLFLRRVDVGLAAEKDGEWRTGPAVRFELPLFDQNQAQVARAREALAQRELLLEALTLAAAQEVRSALARVQTSRDTVALYRSDILARSEETLIQARESYRLGKTTILPALEAQRQLLAARGAHAERQLQAATALSDLERATGTPRVALLNHSLQQDR